MEARLFRSTAPPASKPWRLTSSAISPHLPRKPSIAIPQPPPSTQPQSQNARTAAHQMPLPRPSSSSSGVLRASRCLLATRSTQSAAALAHSHTATTTIAAAAASFSTHSRARAAADHAQHDEDHYDPPSGWLWGIKPGEKYEKEGWEGIWVWGFFGSLGLAVVAYAFKPDTSIQTWALEEARRRLEAEGILKEPDSES